MALPIAPSAGLRVVGDMSSLDAETRRGRAAFPVALVSMPLAYHTGPSIQIGLLSSIASSHGFPVRTFHFYLDFAAQIGLETYELLSQYWGMGLGEWVFSLAAFGGEAPDPDDRFLDEFATLIEEATGSPLADPAVLENARDRLREIRHLEVPRFLDRLLAEVPWHEYRVVGLTSTFQQNVASLAFGRRLKESFPELSVVYGGANFDGEMGAALMRSARWIDYVISGEADLAFPAFLIALQQGHDAGPDGGPDPSAIPGVLCRREGRIVRAKPASPFEAIDELPIPNYDDYFERAERLGLLTVGVRRQVFVPFESARGCWWGQKQHCTFCGLNDATIAFRSKSPARVAGELAELASRHRSFQFLAVDNILEPSYLTTLLIDLARERHDYNIFYEVKANLNRDQLRLLRDAGVRQIQPGIESLSSHVLALMRKGSRAAQNVNLLRWARHYTIDVSWNVMWGFPGESEGDYREQTRLIPRLMHLQPPVTLGRIRMERFSPLFFDRESYPARFRRPMRCYDYTYPRDAELEEIAYFFEYEFENALPGEAYRELAIAVRAWQEAWTRGAPPSLHYWSSPGLLIVEDLRNPAKPLSYNLDEPLASIYLACSDGPRTAVGVCERLRSDLTAEDVQEALLELESCGLMMRDGALFVSLAIPATPGR